MSVCTPLRLALIPVIEADPDMHLRNVLEQDTGLQQLTSCTPTADPSRRIALLAAEVHFVEHPARREGGKELKQGGSLVRRRTLGTLRRQSLCYRQEQLQIM